MTGPIGRWIRKRFRGFPGTWFPRLFPTPTGGGF